MTAPTTPSMPDWMMPVEPPALAGMPKISPGLSVPAQMPARPAATLP